MSFWACFYALFFVLGLQWYSPAEWQWWITTVLFPLGFLMEITGFGDTKKGNE